MGVAPSSSASSTVGASEVDRTGGVSPHLTVERSAAGEEDVDEGASALFLPPGVLGSPTAARRPPTATQAAAAPGGSASSTAAAPSPSASQPGRSRRSTNAKVELKISADDPMADSLRRDLPDGHVVEYRLQPGSGRAIRTYRMMASLTGEVQANGADSAAGGGTQPSQAGPRLVVKALVVRYEEHLTGVPALLRQQEREMWRVRNTILPPGPEQVPPHHFNVLPYQFWFASSFAVPTLNPTANPLDAVRITPAQTTMHASPPASKETTTHDVLPSKPNRVVARAIYLVRHHVHSTLADKIATRPFLSSSEKYWIAFQIIRALVSLHETGICHGNLTTENVGLTSWNWVLLMDLGTYKPVAIPDDDPSDFVRFFEERSATNTSSHPEPSSSNPATATTDDNKRCYLAPERFYSTGVNQSSFRQRADSIASEMSYGTAATSVTTRETEDDEGMLSTLPSTSAIGTSMRAQHLTPAMDIFSLGCVLVELMLNGERALDLGDLMEYRKHYRDSLPPSLQQKLNKIESSSIRAACRHMLQLDPSQRWKASEYLERLSTASPTAPPPFPPCFTSILYHLLKRCVVLPPDARIALAALSYEKVVEDATGVSDVSGAAYFQALIGPTLRTVEEEIQKSGTKLPPNPATAATNQAREISDEALAQMLLYAPGAGEEDDCFEFSTATKVPGGGGYISCPFPFCNPFPRRNTGRTYYRHRNNLLAETEELLQRLEPQVELTTLSSQHGKEEVIEEPKTAANDASLARDTNRDHGTPRRTESQQPSASPKAASRNSVTSTPALVIYVQFILVTIRHVQFPSSKLVAIQLLHKMAFIVQDDDIRLQRIVPTLVTISQQDTDASVRAWAIRTLTAVLGMIQSFPPSDAQIFPKYIFKRLSHLSTDSSLSVRIAFAECVASLAESALRFLDTTHAIRLYEAVDADTTVTSKEGSSDFPDEVSNLLGHGEDVEEAQTESTDNLDSTNKNPARLKNPTTLIVNTYDEELATLHQVVSRWVVHIATDGGEMASAPKQALLQDVGRLCHFFGHDGVMTFILPQVLAFLNDRHDWRLRAALCRNLPSVCAIAGRVATEHFVVPCVEMALVDGEAQVMSAALHCLSDLMDMKLLTRGTLLGTPIVSGSDTAQSTMGLVEKYAPLLMYPSPDVRSGAVQFVVRAMRSIGFPDDEVFILPLIRPFCRYEPIRKDLLSVDGLLSCLHPPLSRGSLQQELVGQHGDKVQIFPTDAVRERMSSYLTMLSHSRRNMATSETGLLRHNVEGAFKLSVACFVPNQMFAELFTEGLPEWFEALRQMTSRDPSLAPLSALHRFSSTIPHAYQAGLTEPTDSANPPRPMGLPLTMMDWIRQHQPATSTDGRISLEDAKVMLSGHEAKLFGASVRGEWGALGSLDPQFLGRSLHSTQLMVLRIPPLAPRLGLLRREDGRAFSCHGMSFPMEYSGDTQHRSQWKPKAGGLVASGEHTAGVSISRLAISQDYAFAASASHDGTCRLWELRQLVDSAGDLRSCLTYSGHLKSSRPMVTPGTVRLNDVAMMENSHSLATAASDGSIHVWRVEMVSSGRTVAGQAAAEAMRKGSTATSPPKTAEAARISGTSVVRVVDSREGEVFAVSHFNSMSSSVLVFATQGGVVHSWDLRSSSEPFALPHRPEFGYLTSMAVGGDRNWMITGSHRGFLSLWDLRFPRLVKQWRHSGAGPIHRLATSYLPHGPRETASETPLAYLACGNNEASIFDISTASCRQCFRVLDPSHCYDNRSELPESYLALPTLQEVRVPFHQRGLLSSVGHLGLGSGLRQPRHPEPSIRSMLGRFGTSGNNYLITGGTDCCIRYWDFSSASRCYTASGLLNTQPKPIYESVDHGGSRLFLCRQMPLPAPGELPSSKTPRSEHRGPIRPENHHRDAILDMKKVEYPLNGLLSCSADGIVKFWR